MTNPKSPISVLIATKNEERNLPRCLDALHGWADEVVVVDSQSQDRTASIAQEYGAEVLQFSYKGGWPKKRQWALDEFPWKNEWILVLDADEVLLPELRSEVESAISSSDKDGYWISLRIVFLGRMLRFGNTRLWKLCLFRKGKGRYERRLEEQDTTMSDIEIHEHVIVDGNTGTLENAIRHENFNSLDRYIAKHNEYSNWEANVYLYGSSSDHKPNLFGSQAQRRRWLKGKFLMMPGASLLRFFQTYIFNLGFLDGLPGFFYSGFKAVQIFHVKAKIYELRKGKCSSR